MDSQNENIVWVLNHAGTLWKSTDGGATFSIVQQTGSNPQGQAYLSLSGSNIIAGQMLSFDGGSTWSALPSIAYETAALATPGAILIGADSGSQGFLSKWSSDCGVTMLFSTFLPASPSGLAPIVVSDSTGDTWVAGGSLMKFDPSGKELLSQSLSGLTPRAMRLDPSGNVYVAANYYGASTGCDIPASQNGSIPVLMKFSPQGGPIYSNPLPQLCPGFVYGIAADASGAVYLAGSTTSTSLSTTSRALQPTAPPTPKSRCGRRAPLTKPPWKRASFRSNPSASSSSRFGVGLSTNLQVIQYENFLAQARSTEVASTAAYVKARIALLRATGTILDDAHVSIDEALRGRVERPGIIP